MFIQVINKYTKELKATIKPAFESDVKDFFKLKKEQYLEVINWTNRNLKFHKKFFALLKCAIHHMNEGIAECYKDEEYLRKYLMIVIGYSDIMVIPGKGLTAVPKSISFRKCSQKTFEDVYMKSLNAIVKYFLYDIDKEDFEADILNFY